jgi:hypothetical protein
MSDSTAILLSTCDRYRPIARYTLDLFDRYWPDHPPVVVCGCSRFEGADAVPLRGDPRDWVEISRLAAEDLLERGFTGAYLILEDHPPLGRCNAPFLNETLPAWSVRHGATRVSLVGWDQFNSSAGDAPDSAQPYFSRDASDYKWRFDLHPAYWNLRKLRELLTVLQTQTPPPRTARDFESRASASAHAGVIEMSNHAYRINGDRWAVGGGWYQNRTSRALLKKAIDLARFLTIRLRDPEALRRLDARLSPYLHYYHGPYPIFWSGLFQSGAPSNELAAFLRQTGQHVLAREIGGIYKRWSAP